MKNKLIKTIILALMIILFMQIEIFANTLILNITTEKQEVKVGDKFKVIVSWDKEMQAADFYLKYDSEKVEYIEADIADDYINSEDKGQVRTAWFSMDNTDKTQIEYTFKAKKSGRVNFETSVDSGGFATGNLQIPNRYKEGNLTIEISQNPIITVITIAGIIIIALIIFITVRIINNKRGKKSHRHIYKYQNMR